MANSSSPMPFANSLVLRELNSKATEYNYDIGNIPDWLQANVRMGIKHDDGEMHDAVRELLEKELGADVGVTNEYDSRHRCRRVSGLAPL